MIIGRLVGLALAATVMVGASGHAQERVEDRARFDVVLEGVTAGRLDLTGLSDGTSYAVSGALRTKGLAAILKQVRYEGAVQGSLRKGRYRPARYVEAADTGKRQSRSEITYRGGVPAVVSYLPAPEPQAWDVDPATQGGSVDPLTALYAVLRDVAPEEACQVSLKIFDGRRASDVALGGLQADGDGITCRGLYRRIAGFPAADMDERTSFAFHLTYAPTAAGRLQVVEVTMETLFGTARMIRQ